jgi:hypothetical protein
MAAERARTRRMLRCSASHALPPRTVGLQDREAVRRSAAAARATCNGQRSKTRRFEMRPLAVQDGEWDQLVLGSPQPHLRSCWAHPSHICAGTGLTPATSAPGLLAVQDGEWDQLVQCDACRVVVHQACYGITDLPQASTRQCSGCSRRLWGTHAYSAVLHGSRQHSTAPSAQRVQVTHHAMLHVRYSCSTPISTPIGGFATRK